MMWNKPSASILRPLVYVSRTGCVTKQPAEFQGLSITSVGVCIAVLPSNPAEFHRLSLDDFPNFKSCFRLCVTVSERKEDGNTVIVQYHPTTKHRDHPYLNIWNDHMSYVTSFPSYAKKLQCSLCHHLFHKIYNLKSHIKICRNLTKYVCPGGLFKDHRTVCDELHDLGISTDERFYPYFMAYDFEAVLEKLETDSTTETFPEKPVTEPSLSAWCPLAAETWKDVLEHLGELSKPWRTLEEEEE